MDTRCNTKEAASTNILGEVWFHKPIRYPKGKELKNRWSPTTKRKRDGGLKEKLARSSNCCYRHVAGGLCLVLQGCNRNIMPRFCWQPCIHIQILKALGPLGIKHRQRCCHPQQSLAVQKYAVINASSQIPSPNRFTGAWNDPQHLDKIPIVSPSSYCY